MYLIIRLCSLLVVTFSPAIVSCEALAKSAGSDAGSSLAPGSGRWALASGLGPYRHYEGAGMSSQEDDRHRHGRGRPPLAFDVGAGASAFGPPISDSDSEKETELSAEQTSDEVLDFTRLARVLHEQHDLRTSSKRHKAEVEAEAEADTATGSANTDAETCLGSCSRRASHLASAPNPVRRRVHRSGLVQQQEAEAEPRANRAGEDTGKNSDSEAAFSADAEHSQVWLRGRGGSGSRSGMDRSSFWGTRAVIDRSLRRPDHEAGNVPCEVINQMAGWVIRNCGYSRLVRRACESGAGSAATSSGAASLHPFSHLEQLRLINLVRVGIGIGITE